MPPYFMGIDSSQIRRFADSSRFVFWHSISCFCRSALSFSNWVMRSASRLHPREETAIVAIAVPDTHTEAARIIQRAT